MILIVRKMLVNVWSGQFIGTLPEAQRLSKTKRKQRELTCASSGVISGFETVIYSHIRFHNFLFTGRVLGCVRDKHILSYTF